MKQKRLWIVRSLLYGDYYVVDKHPYFVKSIIRNRWYIDTTDCRILFEFCYGELEKYLPHLKMEPGECTEIKVRGLDL